MSILETIKQASTDAGFKGLSFANLQEFNAFMDSFTFLEYPRNVVVPFNLTGTFGQQGKKNKVLQLQGWALTRIAEDTNDWRSIDLEPKYIQPMRDLAEKFMASLVNSDIINPEAVDISYSIKTEYMFLAAHLFGVSYTINLPISGRIC